MPSVLIPSNPYARHRTVSSVHLNALRGAAALVVLLGHTRSLFFSSLSGSGDLSTAVQTIHESTGSRPGPITMGNEAVIYSLCSAAILSAGA